MNNRYLFKAKGITGRNYKKDEQWVTGAIMYIENKCMMLIEDEDNLLRVQYPANKMWSADIYAIEVDESTLCQCTGLNDKNSNLIWENDIVEAQYGKAVVVWDKSEWRIKWIDDLIWRKDLHYWAVENSEGAEVIGNIFDNPELLESERNNETD